VLLLPLVDAGKGIEAALDGPQQRRQVGSPLNSRAM
jgi:hypothetical protein